MIPTRPNVHEILCWMFVQLEAWLKDRRARRLAAAALNEHFQTAKGKAWLASKRPAGGKFRIALERSLFYQGGSAVDPSPVWILEVVLWAYTGTGSQRLLRQFYWAN